MTALLGAVPPRYNCSYTNVDLDTYFAMARGNKDVPAMEMTKWFDTNYHYIVPEFTAATKFAVSSQKLFDDVKAAQAMGFTPRPVLVGPVTYLMLGKSKEENMDVLSLLPRLLPVYQDILKQLKTMGVEWVQIDEPILATDITEPVRRAFADAYAVLGGVVETGLWLHISKGCVII